MSEFNNQIEGSKEEIKSSEPEHTWECSGKKVPLFLACGEAAVETNIVSLKDRQPTGNVLRHIFKWDRDSAFIKKESANITKLKRLGRSNEQEVDTSNQVTINAEFYKSLIDLGLIRVLEGNSQYKEIEKTREDMIKLASNFPEDASEAIETWLEQCSVEVVEEDYTGDFEYLFETPETIRVKWTLGQKDNPLAIAILTFKPPKSETREAYEDGLQKIKSRKIGELSVAELSENFARKIKYGSEHLIEVEGIRIGDIETKYSPALKQKFIVLWNPIWFADCVDSMHESFYRTEGKSGKN